MLAAAHNRDLAAAQRAGLGTAFIPRPTEHGPGQTEDLTAEGDWDRSAPASSTWLAAFPRTPGPPFAASRTAPPSTRID